MRPILVTGCGRSGTGYTATLFRAAGLDAGHEAIFKAREPLCVDFGKLDVESSWYAAPYLDRLRDDVIVVHQLREPMDVIRSWVPRRTFRRFAVEGNAVKHIAKRALRRPPSGDFATRQFIRDHVPAVFEEKSEPDRAARYWIEWNRLIAARGAGLTDYRRVWLDQIDSSWTARLLADAGASDAGVQRALERTPRNINTRGGLAAVDLSPHVAADVEHARREHDSI